MSLPVDIREEARDELRDGYDWYEGRRAGAGARFVAAVQAAFDLIAAFPQSGRVMLDDIRRVLVLKYPYAIFYREEAGRIIVTSVFHTSRDPAIWQGRR
jgi:plasmid stabilization system protein ParE